MKLRHLFTLLGMLATQSALADIELRFGTYTADKPSTVVKQFRPILNGLEKEMSAQLKEPVSIKMVIASSYEAGVADLAAGRVDFSRFGPASYVTAKREQPGLRLLAMETNKGKKVFQGAIVVHKDATLSALAQLKGRRFAFGDNQSTIGRYLAQLALLENGVKARDLAAYEYLDRHDAVGAAVALGKFDAGALKEGTYKDLAEKGSPLRVLVTFPNVTKPWIASAGLDARLFDALRQAMFSVNDAEAFKVLKSDGADGFGPSEDSEYDRIRIAMDRNPEFFK